MKIMTRNTTITYNEEALPGLLPVYYKRLFPKQVFCKWLCYGKQKKLNRREISLTLDSSFYEDVYWRYQSVDFVEEFGELLCKNYPLKIDIGAIYQENLKENYTGVTKPVQREVVFDIDLTDYDDIRTCCFGADICEKCWKFMVIASKVLDASLREDFDFKHILWVFSGRRGIHCWVADKKARMLDDKTRSAVAEYLVVIGAATTRSRVKVEGNVFFLRRTLKIIDEYFEIILVEQDFLGTNERLRKFLNNMEDDLRPLFQEAMSKVTTSKQRWEIFETTCHTLLEDEIFPKTLVEEMKLYYSYPRLDINVTKSMDHLMKAPFCVHPRTGKISVPFEIENINDFHPSEVPTICQLLHEIEICDDEAGEYEEVEGPNKTGLFKYVTILDKFLKDLIRRKCQSSS